ncbi:substrate-binding periplasmic protein [Pseudomonas sp. HK3]|jgi:polar amino acid transport system substrate-binding protein
MDKVVFRVLVLIIGVLSQNLALAKEEVTIYGDKNYPPYSYEVNGIPKGIYVDVLNLAFSNMPDYDITIQMIPWSRGIKYIEVGKGLALFPPYYLEARTPWMLFSESILKENVAVFGKSENLEDKTKWPEDFYGYKIGLTRGYNPFSMGGDNFGKAVKSEKITIEEANSNHENLIKLEKGRIDFYITDQLIDIKPYPLIKRGMIVNTNHGYLGFTQKNEVFKYKADFIQQFNRIIIDLKQSGEIQKIVEHYVTTQP